MNETERKMYSVICRHDGIKARDIAKEIGLVHRKDINHIIYHHDGKLVRDGPKGKVFKDAGNQEYNKAYLRYYNIQ